MVLEQVILQAFLPNSFTGQKLIVQRMGNANRNKSAEEVKLKNAFE